jgi:preprotein translocase subunit SecG
MAMIVSVMVVVIVIVVVMMQTGVAQNRAGHLTA